MPDIETSTRDYERWLASRTRIVRSDLALKHQRMRDSPFIFLRATYYRWSQIWPMICDRLLDAPPVAAVGDLHLENFGTWRDREGRLVWGINDLDEASMLPYANDLVRLATSATLAARECHLALRIRDICGAIADGYAASVDRAGEPIVLAERRGSLRDVALSDLRDPRRFWKNMASLPPAKGEVPHDALRALMPDRAVKYSVRARVAGVGSLGRQRFVAIAQWEGGLIAREAKADVGSVAGSRSARARLLERAVRARDPFFASYGPWLVRRLAPDCSKIEIDDLPKQRDEERLLRAMGWETANLHLASPTRDVVRDLRGRRARWLERAAADMCDGVIADWRSWKR